MVNYANGKIYKLVSGGLTYIGSTTQNLAVRKAGHKQSYNRWRIGKYRFVTSFKLFENGDVDIFLLEDFPCDRKEQLHARERHWIESTECVNKMIPGRTKKEYQAANRDEILAYKKEYRAANRDDIRAYKKEYQAANRERELARQKAYYAANREKRKEYAATPVECAVCGRTYRRSTIRRHERTIHKMSPQTRTAEQ